MRKELKKIGSEKRHEFTAKFERFGSKNGWRGPEKTVLIVHVKDDQGKIVSDHLWFNFTKGFEKLNLVPGDIIQFSARVSEYEKGYKGYGIFSETEFDYKLSYPTKIKKINLK